MVRVARHAEKLQLYLAFARSTTPIHGVTPKVGKNNATLPRVRAFDHANPWYIRVARHAEKLQLYLAFARWTTPIHGKGCIPDRWHGAGSGFRKKDKYTEM